MKLARPAIPITLVAVLAASSCGLLPGDDDGGPPPPSSAASAKPGDLTGGRHYRTGWFGKQENTASFDVHRVERYASYSVLHMDVYVPRSTGFQGWFGAVGNTSDFSQFALLDPVGKTYYRSMRESGEGGESFGTRIGDWHSPDMYPSIDAQPGVRYPVEVYFPPVPAGVPQITVVAPGTMGEMTGIPVLDSGKSQAPVPKPDNNSSDAREPKRGQTFFYPVVPPKGRIWSQKQALHDYAEGLEKSTSSGGGEEKIALRTDVLFAFDKANLSSKATRVLDDAINQTRAHADPAKPPVTITGFTDAKGSDAYNRKLSRRRADAVRKYISAKLGTAYRYQPTGKGEADPVAANTDDDGSDNPAGRAKNRRVEIGYKIKQKKAATGARQSAAPQAGAAGAPGRFRSGDGPVVGSLNSPDPTSMIRSRLDVHPLYRDGAYLVGVFTLHNNATVLQELQIGLSDPETKAVGGATLGGVTVTDPVHKTRGYVTRRSPFDSSDTASFVEGSVGFLEHGQDNRLFAYYPAPPAGVTKVNVDAGKWGTVRNVPIQ